VKYIFDVHTQYMVELIDFQGLFFMLVDKSKIKQYDFKGSWMLDAGWSEAEIPIHRGCLMLVGAKRKSRFIGDA